VSLTLNRAATPVGVLLSRSRPASTAYAFPPTSSFPPRGNSYNGTKLARSGWGVGGRVSTLNLEATGQRAGSVYLAERLGSFFSSIHRAFHGEHAGKNGCGGSRDGWCEIRSARTPHNTNCIKRGSIQRAQGCCPWSPPQEGARDQSASARRGFPSKGEARALHHQPRPSIDLDPALPLLSSSHWLLDH
jgi:hypothetical protein